MYCGVCAPLCPANVYSPSLDGAGPIGSLDLCVTPKASVSASWWDVSALIRDAAANCYRCLADVTRRAGQLLLAHHGLLSPPQLARLAAKMSEVGMLQEITGLVDSSVASGSHQGQAVGFVAAALTGRWSHSATGRL